MTETDPLAAAQRLEPLVTTLRSRLDRERRLPDELVQTIGDAGLFGMWLPRALGGPERPPLVFMESIEELSRQDGSVGWCTTIAAGHGRFAGALPSHAASDIFCCGRTVLAGTLNPAGEATAVRGGYRVTGRWGYGSVIDHAQWVYGNCVTHDEHGCCRSHGDAPALRLCLFPRAAADVIDTWHVSGLRGTGSHDFAVTDLFVPEDNTVPPGFHAGADDAAWADLRGPRVADLLKHSRGHPAGDRTLRDRGAGGACREQDADGVAVPVAMSRTFLPGASCATRSK
jgi:alkylation response protein AidB-like acyl-CoA dehydrogenase